jgi:hypothetical protein
MVPAEKVRPQFLSLRQLTKGVGVFGDESMPSGARQKRQDFRRLDLEPFATRPGVPEMLLQ